MGGCGTRRKSSGAANWSLVSLINSVGATLEDIVRQRRNMWRRTLTDNGSMAMQIIISAWTSQHTNKTVSTSNVQLWRRQWWRLWTSNTITSHHQGSFWQVPGQQGEGVSHEGHWVIRRWRTSNHTSLAWWLLSVFPCFIRYFYYMLFTSKMKLPEQPRRSTPKEKIHQATASSSALCHWPSQTAAWIFEKKRKKNIYI